MATVSLATFRADVTPPVGHPLCGGWAGSAVGVTDPLYALGVVLWGEEEPVMLCALDWCELCNDDHFLWRQRLAEAAETTPDRVAVQCVHQHNAPWLNGAAQRFLDEQGVPWRMADEGWCAEALERVAQALRASLAQRQPVTHVAWGQAKVEQVASNRRVMGPEGKVKAIRWTATKDPAVRAEPEGLIDPFLKTLSFWNGERKLAALHYYAVHPCSYYGDGWVTSDFVGLARERRTQEEGVPHLYFTGCAGNVTPGKYNDGSPENRPVLTQRVHTAMVASEEQVQRVEVDLWEWRVKSVVFPAREDWDEGLLRSRLADESLPLRERAHAALPLAYRRRLETPIPLVCLRLGPVWVLHLPGEAFIEYQLFAQEQRPSEFVAVASYGDCGTGYIPLAQSFEEGGYEPTAAYVSPQAEGILREAIQKLLH